MAYCKICRKEAVTISVIIDYCNHVSKGIEIVCK